MSSFDEFLRKTIPKELRDIIELLADAEQKLNVELIPPEWRKFVRLITSGSNSRYPVIDLSGVDGLELDDEDEDESIPVDRPLKTYPDFLEEIFRNPAGVHLIVGKIGSGKTALSLRLAEIFRDYTGNSVYVMNMPLYPDWVEGEIDHFKLIKMGGKTDVNFVMTDDSVISGNNSIVIIDDASTMFDSWTRGEQNRYLKYLMFIARHKNCAVIINSQESSSINKYVESQAKSIWIKEPSIMFEDTERKLMAKLISEAKEYFMAVPPELRNNYAYVVTHDGKAFVKVSLPTGWNEDISRNKQI